MCFTVPVFIGMLSVYAFFTFLGKAKWLPGRVKNLAGLALCVFSGYWFVKLWYITYGDMTQQPLLSFLFFCLIWLFLIGVLFLVNRDWR
jgi:hypothetical protein